MFLLIEIRWTYTFGLLELEGNNRAEVAGNVLVGEVVGREPTEGSVSHVANVLAIGRVLAIAGHPNHVELRIELDCLNCSFTHQRLLITCCRFSKALVLMYSLRSQGMASGRLLGSS